jgi:hypothetical protein
MSCYHLDLTWHNDYYICNDCGEVIQESGLIEMQGVEINEIQKIDN